MFSHEDRMKAVGLYIANGHRAGPVIKELGYPSPNALRAWYREYEETGGLRVTFAHKPHFSPKQVDQAVTHYFDHGRSYTGTSRALGYPNRNMLRQWVKESGREANFLNHKDCANDSRVVRYTEEEKRAAVLEWISGVPDCKVAAQRHISCATLYNWRKKYLPDGRPCPMPKKKADRTTSLESAEFHELREGACPIIHSDRGGHYRWPKWVEIVERANLTRSMSRNGCSQDNSACEGFFGRIKNEMFYGKSWIGVSVEDFMADLNDYLHWYNEDRIKLSLGAMSPRDYRQKLGLI